MDNLTHSLVALTLARTQLRRAGRGATMTLLVASNAPDCDVVAAVTGGGAAYLEAHRGSSHGLPGAAGLALATAILVYAALLIRRWRRPPAAPESDAGDASLPALIGLALIGTIGHVLMDLPTSYGTRILSPFDRTWYAVDLMPIIDVYLWVLLAAGLAAIRFRPQRQSAIAAGVLLLVLANYGLRLTLHDRALGAARDGGPPAATLAAWPDAPAPKLPSDFPCDARPCRLATAALPTFGSPFRWRIVRQFSDGYQVYDLDLLRSTDTGAEFVPHQPGTVLEGAIRRAPVAGAFLAFSRFPAARIDRNDGHTDVRLADVRFLDRPISSRGEEFRPGGLFNVFVRLDRNGGILDDRFGR